MYDQNIFKNTLNSVLLPPFEIPSKNLHRNESQLTKSHHVLIVKPVVLDLYRCMDSDSCVFCWFQLQAAQALLTGGITDAMENPKKSSNILKEVMEKILSR